MANLQETGVWEAGIYQLETSDPVMGGAGGISNRAPRQLANRTLWLKNELASAVQSIGINKADKTTQVIAGNGLTGGGDLTANRTLALGTPGTITASSANAVQAASHTHAIDAATTGKAGIVQLSSAINNPAENMAATPKAVMDALAAAMAGNLTMHGALGSKNLNDLIGQAHYGIHHQTANAAATADLNYPVQKAGTLVVLPSAYSGVQMYIPLDTSVIHIRHQAGVSGSMSPWRSIGGVEDTLTSTNTTTALSAAQGKVLNDAKADASTAITAGNGLTGGGTLAANRTLALGTPGTITASSTNAVQSASHTHAIDSSILVPSGSVVFVAGDTVPAGWLKANGAAVSRTTYASLFAAIGTRYGAGNGSTTFNLPDLRGLFVRGWDDGRGVDSGRALGSRQESANQDHYHALPTTSAGQHETGIGAVFVDNQVSTSPGVAAPSSLLSESGNNPMLTGGVELRTYSQSKTLAAASESRPVNMALMACIKI